MFQSFFVIESCDNDYLRSEKFLDPVADKFINPMDIEFTGKSFLYTINYRQFSFALFCFF
jgi:hypothetical protein